MGRLDTHKQLLALWTALDGGPKPRCRDCADYNGRCPSDNLPCEPQDRALEQIANLQRLAAKPADEGWQRPRAFLDWAAEIFGPVASAREERALRFLEEALEVAHAEGFDLHAIDLLITRIWRKDPSRASLPREIGQALVCLEMFAESIGISAEAEATREFERVRSIPKAEWTKRHDAKVALGIALSTTREPKS